MPDNKKRDKRESSTDDLSYQELEARVEEIIKRLQDEELPLDEASKLYKEGTELTRQMDRRLKELTQQVKDEVKE